MMMVRRKFQKRRGAILLNVLIFLVVISILLAGMGQLMVSDYSIGKVESSYSNSLAVAEAGVNYEVRKISNSAATADQKQGSGLGGTSYTTAAGTFQVYVTQRNADGTETTPWTAGKNLWIYSIGGVSNLTRTVKVAATAYNAGAASNYAVFGAGTSVMNGPPTTINGDIGTNGQFTFNNHPTVNGNVIFNGSGSGWQSPPNATYTIVNNANPVSWPTVETVAVNTFGAQGLNYVAANNDNALASPAISNNMVLTGSNQTFVGKAGGANYYLTSLTCNGSAQIVFNNTNGPITLWFGPSGSSSTFVFNGGTATIKPTSDPTNAKSVRIYLATTNDVQLNGNAELDAGIYNLNNSGSGRVLVNGSPTIYGGIVANMFNFNGSPNITAMSGYFSSSGGATYYGCVAPWQEIGGVN